MRAKGHLRSADHKGKVRSFLRPQKQKEMSANICQRLFSGRKKSSGEGSPQGSPRLADSPSSVSFLTGGHCFFIYKLDHRGDRRALDFSNDLHPWVKRRGDPSKILMSSSLKEIAKKQSKNPRWRSGRLLRRATTLTAQKGVPVTAGEGKPGSGDSHSISRFVLQKCTCT